MIPQIQDRISNLEKALDETGQEIRNLRENISELREQLQIERPPRIEGCSTRVMDYAAEPACKPSAPPRYL